MALTKNEALERAKAIWGDNDYKVRAVFNGKVMVENGLYIHYLDGNGHPTCHKECVRLEASAYERKLLR